MTFISMKWKLSASFVLLTMAAILLYVLVAKRTFEDDKISYVLETQQREMTDHAEAFRARVQRLLFDAKAIQAGTGADGAVGAPLAELFHRHPALLAIDVRSGAGKLLSIAQEGIDGTLLESLAPGDAPGKLRLETIGADYFGLAVREASAEAPIDFRLLFKLDELLPTEKNGAAYAFLRKDPSKYNILRTSPGARFAPAELESFLAGLDQGPANRTMQASIGAGNYFVSLADSGVGDFRFASFVDESRAVGALQVLFRRSLVFVFFSTCVTIIVALLLSKGLTSNINALTRMASSVGSGNFDVDPGFEARDEIGILAKAFRQMTTEIRRLIQTSIEKTRMEEELRTTRLVQGSLFPAKSDGAALGFRIAGSYRTSTECGGDWWYYYRHGDIMYVAIADATGHGTPAALVTSAARAVFSVMEDREQPLTEIMRAWDQAVRRCSNGRIFMTGQLTAINLRDGRSQIINAGHELPIILRPRPGDACEADFRSLSLNGSLGESVPAWTVDEFTIQPGERLILFTDGLLAIEDNRGRGLGEKRFLRFLEEAVTPEQEARGLIELLERKIEETTGDRPLPDDITMVVIDRRPV